MKLAMSDQLGSQTPMAPPGPWAGPCSRQLLPAIIGIRSRSILSPKQSSLPEGSGGPLEWGEVKCGLGSVRKPSELCAWFCKPGRKAVLLLLLLDHDRGGGWATT